MPDQPNSRGRGREEHAQQNGAGSGFGAGDIRATTGAGALRRRQVSKCEGCRGDLESESDILAPHRRRPRPTRVAESVGDSVYAGGTGGAKH